MAIALWPLLAYAINCPNYNYMLMLVGLINYRKKQKRLVVHNSLKITNVLHHGIDASYDWFTFVTKQCFFPWVRFIQMHMVINISLDLLIGIWIDANNFIMKRTMWLFIDKKPIY
jgi:hypothetical protein